MFCWIQNVNWEKVYEIVYSKHFCEKTHEPIINILATFKNVDCYRTLSCLIAQTLCDLLASSQNTNQGLLLNENKDYLCSNEHTSLKKIKAHDLLKWGITSH